MTRKELKKKIERTRAAIKNCETDIIRLSFVEEKREAFHSYDIETYKKYDDLKKENLEIVRRRSEKHFYNSVLLRVLEENYKYLVFIDGCKALEKICLPFDGKAYGEKTKEKIREEMRKCGFSFFFDNRYSSRRYISMAELNDRGCCYGSDYVEGYARTLDNEKYSEFITDENKLVFNHVIAAPYVHYSENPEKTARDIIRLYKKIQDAENNLEKLHSEYRALIPSGLPHCDNFKKLNIRF